MHRSRHTYNFHHAVGPMTYKTVFPIRSWGLSSVHEFSVNAMTWSLKSIYTMRPRDWTTRCTMKFSMTEELTQPSSIYKAHIPLCRRPRQTRDVPFSPNSITPTSRNFPGLGSFGEVGVMEFGLKCSDDQLIIVIIIVCQQYHSNGRLSTLIEQQAMQASIITEKKASSTVNIYERTCLMKIYVQKLLRIVTSN